MSDYQTAISSIEFNNTEYFAHGEISGIQAFYRDTSGTNATTKTVQLDQLKIDLTQGFSEQILAGSVRFKLGDDVFVDSNTTLQRNTDIATGVGVTSGQIHYGTGEIDLSGWTAGANNTIELQSLNTTVDLPPINKVSFRIPTVPIRPNSTTVSVGTVDHGQLILRFSDDGQLETEMAHGILSHDSGAVNINFYKTTAITQENEADIRAQPWFDQRLIREINGVEWIDVPIWVLPDTVFYNTVSYAYIPLDSQTLGLSATRLPIDGRVPFLRIGDVAIVSETKKMTLNSPVAGQVYSLDDQRIVYCEIEDDLGKKVDYDLYTVDYDYGRVTLGGDFIFTGLTPPLSAVYRYQDMAVVRDVQISGQVTFTKPLTHNYAAGNAIVGSVLVIGELQARYTNKFVQQTWNNVWEDQPSGSPISANYNDSLYPIQVTNAGASSDRWAIVFTSTTDFRCIGEVAGQLPLTGNVNSDYSPINPITGKPYFTIKKEGWGAGWAIGNTLRHETIAASFPFWAIRTIQQGEPIVMSDDFQIQLRGDIDRL